MNYAEKIGLGSAQFGMAYGISNIAGQTPAEEVEQILDLCRAQRIRYLDTAPAYGTAEEALGRNDLSAFRVVTKFMRSPAEEFDGSLRRLRATKVYALLAHRPLELLHAGRWEELQGIKADGRVEKIGFSLNTPDELDALLDKGLMPDIVQAPFNYFDDRFRTRMTELKRRGCEIHARSAFLQGLFFRDPATLPPFFDSVKPLLERTRSAGALLKYVLEKDFIDVVVVGVENSSQLSADLRSIESAETLPELEIKISDSILVPSNWPRNV